MKKRFSLLVIVLLLFANAQAQRRITVSTAQEFIKAIGPDVTILMEPGTYVLSELRDNGGNEHVFLAEGYDGWEVYVRNVRNMTIKSKGKQKAELLTHPQYGQVLIFEECENIRLERIIAGHGPEKGYCEGGVLNFKDTKGITLKGCVLYGSGTYGIESQNCDRLTVLGTTIKECTYGIVYLASTSNVTFADCLFKNNEEFGLITLQDVRKANFGSCTFKGNITGDYEGFIFNITGGDAVKALDCSFINNETEYLANARDLVEFKKCKFNGNTFSQGEYPE